MYSRFFRLQQNQRHIRSFSVSNIASSNNREKTSDISASTKALNPKTPNFFNIEKVSSPATSTLSPGWFEPNENTILENILETAEGIKDVFDQLSRPW